MKTSPTSVSDLDLTACEREPIHIPGSIQPHGILFVLAPDTLGIRQLSANAGQILGSGCEAAVGRSLPEVLDAGETLVDHLQAVVRDGGATPLPALRLGSALYYPFAHRSDGELILELESTVGEARSFDYLYPQIRAFMGGLQAAAAPDVMTLAARQVRQMTGFD